MTAEDVEAGGIIYAVVINNLAGCCMSAGDRGDRAVTPIDCGGVIARLAIRIVIGEMEDWEIDDRCAFRSASAASLRRHARRHRRW